MVLGRGKGVVEVLADTFRQRTVEVRNCHARSVAGNKHLHASPRFVKGLRVGFRPANSSYCGASFADQPSKGQSRPGQIERGKSAESEGQPDEQGDCQPGRQKEQGQGSRAREQGSAEPPERAFQKVCQPGNALHRVGQAARIGEREIQNKSEQEKDGREREHQEPAVSGNTGA